LLCFHAYRKKKKKKKKKERKKERERGSTDIPRSGSTCYVLVRTRHHEIKPSFLSPPLAPESGEKAQVRCLNRGILSHIAVKERERGERGWI
jgi:hypothetical protein